jgi:diguanylate cyclase (GGDEF)-like protein
VHSCAIVGGGRVRCWGSNDYGQLGNGTTTGSATPVLATNITDAVAITGGSMHTCALLSSGQVRCWGSNWEGQLGRLAEGAARSALAALAAGGAWRLLSSPWAGPGGRGEIVAGGAYLALFAALVLGAEKLRRPEEPLRPLRFLPPLAVDAFGWALGAAIARVVAGDGIVARFTDPGRWGLAAALLWGVGLLALEAARLGHLQGAYERRAVDLARVSRASRRMAASGFGLAGLASQVLNECRRVIRVGWFQLEVLVDGGPPGGDTPRVRSWWAGPDGLIQGGTADPSPAPPPRLGIHRRLPWRVVERNLAVEGAADGRPLARLKLWCDPREVRADDVQLLDSLLPQLAAWVHRALLDREAREDALTGIPTRRHLERVLAESFGRVLEGGGKLAVLLADIDHFKSINDTWGHPAGDRALVAVAKTLEAHRRQRDTCARYGGEEFALVLTAADGETALEVAERLRRSVEQIVVEERGRSIPLTISLGVAAFPELWASAPGELLALADEALYEAKERGRNRALLNLGRGRYRSVDGDETPEDDRPVEAPRIFA